MDLLELRLLLAVAETGSVAAAAKETGYPRATLRRRLNELEGRAGVPLLKRRTEGTALTPAGERLAAKAGSLIDQARALLRSAAEFAPAGLPPVRLAMTTGAPPSLVVAGYAALRLQFPDLRLDVMSVNHPDELSAERVDVAIHLGEVSDREAWATGTLLHLREMLVASPEYLEHRGRPTRVEDLATHDLLTWKHPDHPHDRWPLLEGGTFPVTPRLAHIDNHLLMRLAAAGHGIALFPETDVDDPAAAALEPVLPDVVGRVVKASYSVPRMLADTPRVKKVIETVQSFMATV
ncbi:MAG: LysR family transcriptional regulator [Myxococcota bacterium]